MSATGALDVASDFDCPVDDGVLRLLLIACVSMLINAAGQLGTLGLGSY